MKLKLKSIALSLGAFLLTGSAALAQTPIADWTFETSMPTTAGPISPEVGSGSAIGHHAGTAAYSSTAGNGSSHSYSANTWATGDYWQFQVSTVGSANIVVTFDAISSSTGPRDFNFQYSTDGSTFTTFTTYTNGNTPGWSAGTVVSSYTHLVNLSSIAALNNASTVFFRLTCADSASSGGTTIGGTGTSRVDNFNVSTLSAPVLSGLTSLTTNAGSTVIFTATVSSGTPPFGYFWYTNSITPANLITAVATNATSQSLALTNVVAANSGNYFVVVSNALTSVNSSASLTVIDPAIDFQPVSQVGFPNGAVQFAVVAGGTGLSYQWFYCTSASDNTQIGSAVTGNLPHGSVPSGANTSVLTITNLQAADVTNFVVIVTGTFGSVTSSVASFTLGTTQIPLAFWNFNSPYMNVSNPAPYQGIGFAFSTNVTPFVQPTIDANDPMTPNTAWGTQNYPAQSTLNTNAGVQFNVSTLGAKNIMVSYDARGTGTASRYHRLQYTTNGIDFINYPLSASIITATTTSSPYLTFNYDLSGFPGVANNTNFGVRIVAEFENTATYGTTNDAQYTAVGGTSTYNVAGTLSYDLVSINGDALGNNQPPTMTALGNLQFNDGTLATNNFTIASTSATPTGSLTITATAPDPTLTGSLSFTYVNNNGAAKVIVTSSLGNIEPIVTPVLVTVADALGNKTTEWFYATILPPNAPPTFGGLVTSTNMLVGASLTIPFSLGDDHTDMRTVTPTVTSGNSTLVTSLTLGGAGSTNRTLTITPVANQDGSAPITLSVTDGGGLTTSQTFYVVVRKTTNILLDDNFTYDGGGDIDLISGGLWQNYSGHLNEMQTAAGLVIVDGVNHTEDVQGQMIGSYAFGSSTVLYSKFYINYTNAAALPTALGSYIAYFTDGSSSNFICRVWASSANSPSGQYQIGITTTTNLFSLAAQVPTQLSPNVSYEVVTRLDLSTATATLWLNPVNESSSSVTATDPNLLTITQVNHYDLRESTADEGILTVSNLAVGLNFNDVVGVAVGGDVSVSQTNAANVFAGNNITYGITVTNNTASAASGVTVADTLPAGATFVSATGGGVNTSGTVNWTVGTLAANAASTFTVTVKAPGTSPITNTVVASTASVDPNLLNNTNSVITTVAPIPVGAAVSSTPGGRITFTWGVQPNVSYSILWSTNVAGPYTAITNGMTFTGTTGTFTDATHTNLPTSFYKISSP